MFTNFELGRVSKFFLFKSVFFLLFLSTSTLLLGQTQEIWGVTSKGNEIGSAGTIYSLDSLGMNYNLRYKFPYFEGRNPEHLSIRKHPNGLYYGIMSGAIFSFNPITYEIKRLSKDYIWSTSSLIIADSGRIFGVKDETNSFLFEFDLSNNQVIRKKSINGLPWGNMVLHSNNKIYGTTFNGSNYFQGGGTIFEYDPTQDSLVIKVNFQLYNLYGGLVSVGSKLYGCTYGGSIFSYDPFLDTLIYHGFTGGDVLGGLINSGGILYGLSFDGGNFREGSIFRYSIAGDSISSLFSFKDSVGAYPMGDLTMKSNNEILGLTSRGGKFNNGTLFEFDINSNLLEKKIEFKADSIGDYPISTLVRFDSSLFFGTAKHGGIDISLQNRGLGTAFVYNSALDSIVFYKKLGLSEQGDFPAVKMIQGSNGKLYGTTVHGGEFDEGVIFEYNHVEDEYTKIHDFAKDGFKFLDTESELMEGDSGVLYGLKLKYQGSNGYLYKYDLSQEKFEILHTFDSTFRIRSSDELIYIKGTIYGICTYLDSIIQKHLFSFDLISTQFRLLDRFDVDDYPLGELIALDSTSFIGTSNRGFYGYDIQKDSIYLFKLLDSLNFSHQGDITKNGDFIYGIENELNGSIWQFNYKTKSFATIYNFTNSIGSSALGLVYLNGRLYGQTSEVGSNNRGVIFSYDIQNQTFDILKSFSNGDGRPWRGNLTLLNYCKAANFSINQTDSSFCFGEKVTISLSSDSKLNNDSLWVLSYGTSSMLIDSNTAGSFTFQIDSSGFYYVSSKGICNSTAIDSIWLSVSLDTAMYASFTYDKCAGTDLKINDNLFLNNIRKDQFFIDSNFTSMGCDSIISYTINVEPDLEIQLIDSVFSAVEDSAIYQWYNCITNTLISNATNRNYIPFDTGYYAAIISKGSCSDTSDCMPYFPVSLAENLPSLKKSIFLFPNPTKGIFTLERKNFKGRLNLKQLTIAGQLIQDVALADELETHITLKGEQGIYFIQITNEQGETATFKVIKQ